MRNVNYVLAGSLGAVGVVPGADEFLPNLEDQELASEEINPSDAEALGDHMVLAFEQARAAAVH